MINAQEYAKALFALSEEEKITDEVFSQLQTVGKVLSENPDYSKLLDTPAISKEEKLSLISDAFIGINEYIVNTVKILAEKHLSHLMGSVISEFSSLYDLSRGIERVEAITAVPLTEKQSAALTSKLKEQTGKTIILTNKTDPSILGGVKLRYSGIQLDGSVKTRLKSFEESLRNLVI